MTDYLQQLLDQHEESPVTPEQCDKGPVIEQIKSTLADLRDSNVKISEALIQIARQQERLVSLADKTDSNREDIAKLFEIVRENEKRFNEFLLKRVNTIPASTAAKNWNNLEKVIVTAATMGALSFFWKIYAAVMGGVTP